MLCLRINYHYKVTHYSSIYHNSSLKSHPIIVLSIITSEYHTSRNSLVRYDIHRRLRENWTNDCGRVKTECDGTRAETRFGLPAKRTSLFISAGVSVQSAAGSRGVRISGSNAG